MAVFTFRATKHRVDLFPTIEFDGTPKFSICKYHGYNESKFELRNKKQKQNSETYDVFVGMSDTEVPYYVGILEYKPPVWAGGPCQNILNG